MTTSTRAGRDWWSLQPVQRPQTKAANPIDEFIGAKLKSLGWAAAPETDRRTLIRRLTFDLHGLPPTFEEIEAFVEDKSANAYEKVVDRLLASPRFGERWARHWLDVVRYAETCGYERDQVKPHVHRYREYVIKAFNEDKPYDRFVLEQLAGDELTDRSEETVIATGFIRLGTWNDEPNDAKEYKYERLEDMVHATSTAFLGLTVKCARCHDHKFDPITQKDYYRMAGAFWAGYIEPGARELLGGPDKTALGHDVLGWTDRGAKPTALHLLKKGDPTRPLDEVPFAHVSFVPALNKSIPAVKGDAKTSQRRLELAKWIVSEKNPLTARVWVNGVWHYQFGAGLVRAADCFGFMGEQPTHPELLDWLASELMRNGWKSKSLHKLIVMSQTYRQASQHPKDKEYVQSDPANRWWRRAEMRRLDAESLRDALLFASGQLDLSKIGGESFSPDISGDALEGLSMKGKAWKASPPEQQRRRSVYIFSKRGLQVPGLTVFDAPDTTLPCGKRDVTISATQALAMLNNRFTHQQSEALAKRATGKDTKARVEAAWRYALGRGPRESELTAALEHLARQEKHFTKDSQPRERAFESLCHVLLNLNEFSYVD